MQQNRIINNAGWMIGCKLVKAVLVLIVTALTARYLGASNYGLMNYAAGLVAFFVPIMKLGLDSTLVHELIQRPDEEGKILGTAIILNLISGCLCVIGVVAFSCIANPDEMSTILVCAVYSLLLVFQAAEMIQYWFQAKLLSKYSAIAMLISYFCVTILQIVLLLNHMSVYWFALTYPIDYMIIAAILLLVYRNISRQTLSFSPGLVRVLLSNSKYYIVSSLMVTVFSQTDRVMLKLMVNNEATGIYSAAATCAGMTSFIFAAIIDSVRPVIFANRQADLRLFQQRVSELYSIIIYCSLAQCLLITLFSPLIIYILYGHGYAASISVLRLVVWFTTFSYLGTIRNIWMLAEGKQKYLWIINASGAFGNVALNFLLIPTGGPMGAALASLLTQIFTNVLLGYLIRPLRENNRLMRRGLTPQNLAILWKEVHKNE